MTEYLIDILKRSTESDVVEISCHAIGKMALYNLAAKKFTSERSVEIISGCVINVIKNILYN